MKAKSEHLWILPTKYDGQTSRMWPSAPRLFLHEFLKPREDIKELLQAKRVFEYRCSSTVYAPRPFVPTTIAHPSFTFWWQEFHDHTFNVLVHSLSEVIYLFFSSFSIMSFFTDHDPLPFSARYSVCSSCQDNLLQHCRPNLCLGI
jgi:hypothetical protein